MDLRAALAHPSNRLYNGEVSSAREALQLYIRQFERERDTPYPGWEKDLEDFDGTSASALSEGFAKGVADGNRLLTAYERIIGAAERVLFTEWAASDDEDVRRVGEACLSGDFASLAI